MTEALGTQINNETDTESVEDRFCRLGPDDQKSLLMNVLRERDVYKKLVEELREQVAKLEQGLLGPKKQRYKGDDSRQLSLAILEELLGNSHTKSSDAGVLVEQLINDIEGEVGDEDGLGDGDDGNDDPHRRRRKGTGRNSARKDLPKIRIEVLPDEVRRLGTDAFERIGEETSTVIERRTSSLVELTLVKPKFRAITDDAIEAVKKERHQDGSLPAVEPEAWITTAHPPEQPIPRGTAGPGLLANVITRRFDDYLPYNRLENVYEREGMRLGRSTMYGWLDSLRPLLAPLIKAMRDDARSSPYVCTDATGVLVQAAEKCKRGHFWVLVAPGKHVLFDFSNEHNIAAVDKLLGDYNGYIVADAHTVYDHLYADGKASEVACWSHARKYFFKVLGTEPEIARAILDNLRIMFLLERKFATKTRKQRERLRAAKVRKLVDRHFAMCREYEGTALEDTPLEAAIRYSLNQEEALRRFLHDGRLPATNNISERQLRRQAMGRNNWLFVGSNDGAEVNVFCATLVASCHMHGIEPERYLRDILCLLPSWPRSRVLELAPCNWEQTRQQPDTQQRLATNVFRKAIIDIDAIHVANI